MEPKFKPGDKVLIARKHWTWNLDGKMDHWLGNVMTIKESFGNINANSYEMVEDKCEYGGWYWREECLEPATAHIDPVEITEGELLSALEVM